MIHHLSWIVMNNIKSNVLCETKVPWQSKKDVVLSSPSSLQSSSTIATLIIIFTPLSPPPHTTRVLFLLFVILVLQQPWPDGQPPGKIASERGCDWTAAVA